MNNINVENQTTMVESSSLEGDEVGRNIERELEIVHAAIGSNSWAQELHRLVNPGWIFGIEEWSWPDSRTDWMKECLGQDKLIVRLDQAKKNVDLVGFRIIDTSNPNIVETVVTGMWEFVWMPDGYYAVTELHASGSEEIRMNQCKLTGMTTIDFEMIMDDNKTICLKRINLLHWFKEMLTHERHAMRYAARQPVH